MKGTVSLKCAFPNCLAVVLSTLISLSFSDEFFDLEYWRIINSAKSVEKTPVSLGKSPSPGPFKSSASRLILSRSLIYVRYYNH